MQTQFYNALSKIATASAKNTATIKNLITTTTNMDANVYFKARLHGGLSGDVPGQGCAGFLLPKKYASQHHGKSASLLITGNVRISVWKQRLYI